MEQGHASPLSDEGKSDRCAVCLNSFNNRTLVDPCFHGFCFDCILQWSDVSRTCPLCKATIQNLIHSIRSERDFQLIRFEDEPPQRHDGQSSDRSFRYRSTQPNRRRAADLRSLWGASLSPRVAASIERRRDVYVVGARAKHMGSNRLSRFRDIGPETFRSDPSASERLSPWLRRELTVLVGPDHVDFLSKYILTLLRRVEVQSDEFLSLMRPFLFRRTDHFVHELVSFARSPYDMVAYDANVQYDGLPPVAGTATAAAREPAPVAVAYEAGPSERRPRGTRWESESDAIARAGPSETPLPVVAAGERASDDARRRAALISELVFDENDVEHLVETHPELVARVDDASAGDSEEEMERSERPVARESTLVLGGRQRNVSGPVDIGSSPHVRQTVGSGLRSSGNSDGARRPSRARRSPSRRSSRRRSRSHSRGSRSHRRRSHSRSNSKSRSRSLTSARSRSRSRHRARSRSRSGHRSRSRSRSRSHRRSRSRSRRRSERRDRHRSRDHKRRDERGDGRDSPHRRALGESVVGRRSESVGGSASVFGDELRAPGDGQSPPPLASVAIFGPNVPSGPPTADRKGKMPAEASGSATVTVDLASLLRERIAKEQRAFEARQRAKHAP